APRPRRAGKGRRARSEEETSLSPAVDDERRCPAALSGPALRVGGGGGPFATSLLLGRALALASSSFLATGPPAPPTRSCGILKRSLGGARSQGRADARNRAGLISIHFSAQGGSCMHRSRFATVACLGACLALCTAPASAGPQHAGGAPPEAGSA